MTKADRLGHLQLWFAFLLGYAMPRYKGTLVECWGCQASLTGSCMWKVERSFRPFLGMWSLPACFLSEWESCPRSQGPQDCLPQARAAMAPGDGLRRRLRVSFAIGVAPDHGRLARFSGCEQGARCAGEVPEHSESLRGALCLLQAEVTAGCMQ